MTPDARRQRLHASLRVGFALLFADTTYLATRVGAQVARPAALVSQARMASSYESEPNARGTRARVSSHGMVSLVRASGEVSAEAWIGATLSPSRAYVSPDDGRVLIVGVDVGGTSATTVWLWRTDEDAPRQIADGGHDLRVSTNTSVSVVVISERNRAITVHDSDGAVRCRTQNADPVYTNEDATLFIGLDDRVFVQTFDRAGEYRPLTTLDPTTCALSDTEFRSSGIVSVVSMRHDGREMIVTTSARTWLRYDVVTRSVSGTLQGPEYGRALYARDGACIVIQSRDLLEVRDPAGAPLRSSPISIGTLDRVDTGCTTLFGGRRLVGPPTVSVDLRTGEVTQLPNATDAVGDRLERPWVVHVDAARGRLFVGTTGHVFRITADDLRSMDCRARVREIQNSYGSSRFFSTLAITTTTDGRVRAFSGAAYCDLEQMTRTDARTLGWSPDGRFVATVDATDASWIHDLDRNAQFTAPALWPHDAGSTSVRFNATGTHVIADAGAHDLPIYETASGRLVTEVPRSETVCGTPWALEDGSFAIPLCEETDTSEMEVSEVTGEQRPDAYMRVDPRSPAQRTRMPLRRPPFRVPTSLACGGATLRVGGRAYRRAGDCRTGDLGRAAMGTFVDGNAHRVLIKTARSLFIVALDEPRVVEFVFASNETTTFAYARTGARVACMDGRCASLRWRDAGSVATAPMTVVNSDASVLTDAARLLAR